MMYRAVGLMSVACLAQIGFLLAPHIYPLESVGMYPLNTRAIFWGIGLALAALMLILTSLRRGEVSAWVLLLFMGIAMLGGPLFSLRQMDFGVLHEVIEFSLTGIVALFYSLGLAMAWEARWDAKARSAQGSARIDAQTRAQIRGPQFEDRPTVDATVLNPHDQADVAWMEQAVRQEVDEDASSA